MRAPTRGAPYAIIYHGLAEVAQRHGYALALHGSLINDLDVVAIPWTDEAVSDLALIEALRCHLTACGFDLEPTEEPERKPHGRIALNLYMGAGSKVDLSILPRHNLRDTRGGSR